MLGKLWTNQEMGFWDSCQFNCFPWMICNSFLSMLTLVLQVSEVGKPQRNSSEFPIFQIPFPKLLPVINILFLWIILIILFTCLCILNSQLWFILIHIFIRVLESLHHSIMCVFTFVFVWPFSYSSKILTILNT